MKSEEEIRKALELARMKQQTENDICSKLASMVIADTFEWVLEVEDEHKR